jgi:hypothetical protein
MAAAAEDARGALLDLCRRWSAEAGAVPDEGGRRQDYFRRELPGLLGRPEIFREILSGLRRGSGYPDLRAATMFANELLLFQDPGRAFSLRMFIFGPGERTPVHDHGAWGVLGSAFGTLEVVRYSLEPRGSRLMAQPPRRLAPGAVELTSPYAAGIHRTGNPEAAGVTLMVNVYGPPGRRLYVQFFDPESGRTRRVYPPRLSKLLLADLAVAAMSGRPAPGLQRARRDL